MQTQAIQNHFMDLISSPSAVKISEGPKEFELTSSTNFNELELNLNLINEDSKEDEKLFDSAVTETT